MTGEKFQLSDEAVAAYEDQKVTAMFAPLARVTLQALPVAPQDSVLDVACGTGIVLRTIHENGAPARPMTGVDINAAMIRKAQECTSDHAGDFDWHIADVENLPFGDRSFSLILCQQGIQYFPDQPAVLSELRRVASDGGRLAISVWGGASPFFQAMAASVANHVDPQTGEKYLAPFSYKNADTLPQMLVDAGFHDVDVHNLMVDRTMEDIEASIGKEILGHPAGPTVKQAGKVVLEAVARDVIGACSEFQTGKDMIVPQRVSLFLARA